MSANRMLPRWAKGVAAGPAVGLVGVVMALTPPGDLLEGDRRPASAAPAIVVAGRLGLLLQALR